VIVSGVFALPFDDPAGFTAPPAFGPFRVLHQIGSGVLGPVFRTFDPQTEKLVAVKVFRLDVVPEVSADLASGLVRLADIPVHHPAVVAVLDAGLEGTTAFLAMEYVATQTLDVSLRRMAPAELHVVLPLLRPVAEAIEAAWAQGIGHGALHPRDIFVPATNDVSPAPGHGVRVSGFGVTGALERLRIPTPGRRPYTAPERETAGAWDIRADVYSLGVIAHELLTGRRPAGHWEQDNEWASGAHGASIRRALEGALATDPRQRFERPTAFLDALTTGASPLSASVVETPTTMFMGVDMNAPPVAMPADLPVVTTDERHDGPEHDVPEVVEHGAMETEVAVSMAPPAPDAAFRAMRDHEPRPVEPAGPVRPVREDTMPRMLGIAAMVVVAFALGTGFGYWLDGPAPAAATEAAPPSVTRGPDDEPIGTEVAVKTPPQVVNEPVPPATPTAAPSRPPARPAPAAVKTGSMAVTTRPAGAVVTVDGRVLGKTPMRVATLSPGSHTVRLTLAGHKTMTTKVVVRAGQQSDLRVSLEIRD